MKNNAKDKIISIVLISFIWIICKMIFSISHYKILGNIGMFIISCIGGISIFIIFIIFILQSIKYFLRW